MLRTTCLVHDHTRVNEHPHGVGGCADCKNSLQHADHKDCPKKIVSVVISDPDLKRRTLADT